MRASCTHCRSIRRSGLLRLLSGGGGGMFMALGTLLIDLLSDVVHVEVGNLNVIVGEFPNLVLVQPNSVHDIVCSQPHHWDPVQHKADQRRHHSGVPDAGGNVGNLLVNLLVVVGDEPTVVFGDTVHANDPASAKQSVEEQPNDPSHAVLSQDIQGVVHANQVLQPCGEVTHHTGDDPQHHRAVDGNITRRRSSSNQP
ncbi:hypothetical protein WICPIJ_008713 [Wickerhamomyces pijperi]|uniref:Uncharacterized protein n=1 Tax=Wickerhamomyces pijperi TaxID=599730 RepID=A0A9P8PWX8_WICPI|nr:hypothetical protein WICPIJ_008713 [Wickerhamomyces pijperi]